ncbi:MAG: hypothetical protein QG671_2207, partial [Actinomycetota bacterium]|nr:hypothetical protein [Actinomycetota bacterium]
MRAPQTTSHWWVSKGAGMALILADIITLLVIAELTAEVDAGS